MDDVVLTQEDGVGYDLPEPGHIQEVFQGLDDSLGAVEGSEGLTNAQVYLQSVLVGSGVVTARVAGNEGFFSTVGEGIKAAYEYIKKMFKSLWDFFFKRDAPKEIEAAKEAVSKGEDALKAVSGGGSDAQTAETLNKMEKTAEALMADPEVNKGEVEHLITTAKEAKKGSAADKKKAVETLAKDLPKVNKKGQAVLKKSIGETISVTKALVTAMETVGEHKDPLISSVGAAAKENVTFLKQFITKLEGIQDLTDVAKAKEVLDELGKVIEALSKGVSNMKNAQGEISSAIKKIEEVIKAADGGKGDGEGMKEAKEEVAKLKELLAGLSAISKAISKSLSRASSLSGKVTAVFGA